jgi:hypothetical protein
MLIKSYGWTFVSIEEKIHRSRSNLDAIFASIDHDRIKKLQHGVIVFADGVVLQRGVARNGGPFSRCGGLGIKRHVGQCDEYALWEWGRAPGRPPRPEGLSFRRIACHYG